MSDPIHERFDRVADGYAMYRPTYDQSLIDLISDHCVEHRLVWEPGCGSGQATALLAKRFDHVLATDPSARAIERAPTLDKATFAVGAADQCTLQDASVDLIASGQAAHWFDMADFAAEATRVAAPGGVVAVWTYDRPRVDDVLNVSIDRLYYEVLAGCWAAGRHHVDTRYASLDFPFEPVQIDPEPIRKRWTIDEMLGYLRTWSAVDAWRQQHDGDAVSQVEGAMRSYWGDGQREVTWPITVRMGKVHSP